MFLDFLNMTHYISICQKEYLLHDTSLTVRTVHDTSLTVHTVHDTSLTVRTVHDTSLTVRTVHDPFCILFGKSVGLSPLLVV